MGGVLLNTPIIQCQHIFKSYRRQQILSDINLEINAGEFFGLVGVNGAGKTTLIKSLLDFCGIDQGMIHLFGIPHIQSKARLGLTFLPEQFLAPQHLSGRSFLKYMALLNGNRYDDASTQVICQHLDLDVKALSKPVRSYSKGMSQKLGLLNCFLSNKPLLLLDEPMSSLDPKTRAFLKHYLLTLKANHLTIFFSTHLLVDVEALCDRMGILHEGQLRFIGTPNECCERFETTSLEEAYLRCIGSFTPCFNGFGVRTDIQSVS
jgi:ABC-2 type transport system ATP-binding protein